MIGGVSVKKTRYLTPDIGRGLMLLFIAVAHAPLFYKLNEGMNEPSLLDQILKAMVVIFVNSRAFVMFSLLFGFGIALMVKRQIERGMSVDESKRLLRRRFFYLILFGFVHQVLIGGSDILAFYGVAGLWMGTLIFQSEPWKQKVLWMIGALSCLTISIGWLLIPLADELSRADETAYYFQMVINNVFAFPITILVQLLFFPFLFVILLGMRVESTTWISHPEHHPSTLKKIAFIGILISMIGASPLAAATVGMLSVSHQVLAVFHILHMFTGIAGGIGYISWVALFSIQAPQTFPKITRWLAAVGRRSLTFYVYQEAFIVLLLSPVAFGLGHQLGYTEVILIAIGIWITSVIIAGLLDHHNKPGPLDALLRKLIYRK